VQNGSYTDGCWPDREKKVVAVSQARKLREIASKVNEVPDPAILQSASIHTCG